MVNHERTWSLVVINPSRRKVYYILLEGWIVEVAISTWLLTHIPSWTPILHGQFFVITSCEDPYPVASAGIALESCGIQNLSENNERSACIWSNMSAGSTGFMGSYRIRKLGNSAASGIYISQRLSSYYSQMKGNGPASGLWHPNKREIAFGQFLIFALSASVKFCACFWLLCGFGVRPCWLGELAFRTSNNNHLPYGAFTRRIRGGGESQFDFHSKLRLDLSVNNKQFFEIRWHRHKT